MNQIRLGSKPKMQMWLLWFARQPSWALALGSVPRCDARHSLSYLNKYVETRCCCPIAGAARITPDDRILQCALHLQVCVASSLSQ